MHANPRKFARIRSRVPAALALLLACAGIGAARNSGPASAAFQASVSRIMAGKPGAVVVLNVSSGKILAKSHMEVAAQRLAQPGSTLKPFVLMELLSSGRVKPEQRLVCRRPLLIGGRRMDCSHPESVDTFDAANAIAYSCNSYFAEMATRLNGEELARVFHHAGLTSPTRLASTEAVGALTEARDEPQLQLQALGDWGIVVTPLELLAAYRGLALKKLRSASGDLGSAAPVFDGLERSVTYGVAHPAQPHYATAAGKTGTAANLNSPRTHGFFAGYAPADKPEIVMVVYVEQGRGIDAAAIAGKVFDAYFQKP